MNAKEFIEKFRNITGHKVFLFNKNYYFSNKKNNHSSYGSLFFRDEDLSPYVEFIHDEKIYYYNFNSDKKYENDFLGILDIHEKKIFKLEVPEDVLDKISSVINNTFFDTRISIPLDMTEKEIYMLMKQAHEKDMTLNKYIEYLLQKVIDKENDF